MYDVGRYIDSRERPSLVRLMSKTNEKKAARGLVESSLRLVKSQLSLSFQMNPATVSAGDSYLLSIFSQVF